MLVHAMAVKLPEGQKWRFDKVLEREENISGDKDRHDNLNSVPSRESFSLEKEVCSGTDSEYEETKVGFFHVDFVLSDLQSLN